MTMIITEAQHSNAKDKYLRKKMSSSGCPLKYAEEMQKNKPFQCFHLEKRDNRKSNHLFFRGPETT